MYITSLSLQNFRNIEDICILPTENINVFYGDNAQGKTNLIEAIWLFT
ncbi:MAG: AAA family ATPase, partial [Oscillospiraceae bacterium]